MRWHRLPLLFLLVAILPVVTASAVPARDQSVTDARVESAVVAADGGVYVAAYAVVTEQNVAYSQDATLVALDPATGAERWRFATGARWTPSPVVADGLAYVHVSDYVVGDNSDPTGTLHAVDAATGAERWRLAAGAPYSPPVVAGGVVYAAGGGHLYALDAASGAERWRRPDVPPLANPLAVDRDTLYAAFFSGDCAAWHLAAFDAATGAERGSWEVETAGNCMIAGPAITGPVVADGVAYVVGLPDESGQGGEYLAALDAATGAERWRSAFGAGGLPVTLGVHAGTVYATDYGAVHAVDAAGGAERWSFAASGIVSPAVAADGTVYVASTVIGEGVQAALHAIDDATGTERWRFLTEGVPTFAAPNRPAVAAAEGVAYVGGGETVYAVDAASGAERWRARLALALPATTLEGDASPAAGSSRATTASPARTVSETDACSIPTDLQGVHGSVLSSVGAADRSGVYVAATIQAVGCDARGDVYLNSQDATLVALDPVTGAERWRFATDAPRMTPPVLAGGLAYVIGYGAVNTDTLYAVDAATGQERWRFATGPTFSVPVVAGGVVYAVGGAPATDLGPTHLYALDAASGTELWRRSDLAPASRLAVDQGTVYAGYCSGDWTAWHLAAFDAATGADRWSLTIETAGNCAVAGPAVADGVAYIVVMTGDGARTDGYLAAFDAATGAERWRWTFDPGGLAVRPVVHAGGVYVVGVATLHAVDAAGGAERWRFDAGGFLWPVVAADGTVFVFVEHFPNAGAADEAALYALDEATGTERWRFPTTAPRSMSEPTFPVVAVAEGIAYVGGGETVYAVDAASGAERWRARLALALPASTPEAGASPAAGS